jgi:hypothetical protein
MGTRARLLAGAATAGLIITGVTPAQAGTTWGSPQEVSSKLGRSISLSNDGRVAAWIRTNRITGTGPVRTAYFKSAKKGWTPSAPIPGTAQVTELQLSADGTWAFAEEPGTGFVMAQRSSGNTWGAASTVISGTQLDYGQMSADASTIAYVDWTGASGYPTEIPGTLKVALRATDGTWGAPVTVASIPYDYYYEDYAAPIALSADGSTLGFIDETFALRVSSRQADGTWAVPVLVKQYPSDPYLAKMQFSSTGSTLIWSNYGAEGVLYTSRGASGWSPVGYVTTDEVTGAAITPSGKAVAYGNEDGSMTVRTWNGVKWAKPTVLGAATRPVLAVTNKTIAWTSNKYNGSALRVSIYTKGAWQKSSKRSSAAQSPAVTLDGTTLAWGATSNKRIYSIKR